MEPTSPLADDLLLDGVFNLRDLGGIALRDGTTTNRGVVLRADGLHRSPVDQRQTLVTFGVRRVVDLRTSAEAEREGRFDPPGVDYHHVPVIETLAGLGERIAPDVDDLLAQHYLYMLDHNGPAFAAALERVADAVDQAHPVVFHCTAGKDRTGLLAALILAGIGVDDEEVADDYTRSAASVADIVAWYRARSTSTPDQRMAAMGMAPEVAKVMMSAPRRAMLTVLDELGARPGGLLGYMDGVGAASAVERIARGLVAAV